MASFVFWDRIDANRRQTSSEKKFTRWCASSGTSLPSGFQHQSIHAMLVELMWRMRIQCDRYDDHIVVGIESILCRPKSTLKAWNAEENLFPLPAETSSTSSSCSEHISDGFSKQCDTQYLQSFYQRAPVEIAAFLCFAAIRTTGARLR